MKINPLDAHDRLKSFTQKQSLISECIQDIIDQRPFGNHPFYIWGHGRTDDDGVTKRMIWQPRLTRPLVQTNSMLFKAYPGTDIVKICWIVPARELWGNYDKGNVTEAEGIAKDIHDFEYNRAFLNRPEEDDLSEPEIDQIYKDLSQEAKRKKFKKSLEYAKGSLLLPWDR
jgi:hypothetical protein